MPTSTIGLLIAASLSACAVGYQKQSTTPVASHPARQKQTLAESASPALDAPVSGAQTGLASYYSDRLAGRSTASGEPYRPTEFTAASRTLPFGTRLRVTRLDAPKSVVVRVNDRGPFGDHRRILDLSRAAAAELDMIKSGVVPVRADIIGR